MEIYQIDTDNYLETLPKSYPTEKEVCTELVRHWNRFIDDVLGDATIFGFLTYLSDVIADEYAARQDGPPSVLAKLEEMDTAIDRFVQVSHAYNLELVTNNNPDTLSYLFESAMAKFESMTDILSTRLHLVLPLEI